MKKIKLFLSLFFSFFLLSDCTSSVSRERKNYIVWDKLDKKSWKDIPDGLLGEKQYILLENESEDFMIGRVRKIDYINATFLIHDDKHNFQKLLTYNPESKQWNQFGQKGQGPFEYLNITSAEIDREGNVYLMDGHLKSKTILKFNSKGEGLETMSMPLEADVIKALRNGGFIFALSSWNRGQHAGDRIVVTDSEFNIKDAHLKYDEFFDDGFMLSGYSLYESDNHIFYSRTIENFVYSFDIDGKLETIYEFDFGKQNVPDEIRKDIEPYYEEELKKYCMLYDFVIFTDGLILGKVFDRKEIRMFLIDRKTNCCYLSDIPFIYTNNYLKGFRGRMMIHYIDQHLYEGMTEKEKQELPEEVINHLEEDQAVICMQKLLK